MSKIAVHCMTERLREAKRPRQRTPQDQFLNVTAVVLQATQGSGIKLRFVYLNWQIYMLESNILINTRIFWHLVASRFHEARLFTLRPGLSRSDYRSSLAIS